MENDVLRVRCCMEFLLSNSIKVLLRNNTPTLEGWEKIFILVDGK